MTKPIRPEDIKELKLNFIPEEVIEIFNEAIVEKWNGKSATINQNYIVDKIKEKLEINPEDIFRKHYLDVEEIFRDAGWVVNYDKPAYNETYQATFEFKKRR